MGNKVIEKEQNYPLQKQKTVWIKSDEKEAIQYDEKGKKTGSSKIEEMENQKYEKQRKNAELSKDINKAGKKNVKGPKPKRTQKEDLNDSGGEYSQSHESSNKPKSKHSRSSKGKSSGKQNKPHSGSKSYTKTKSVVESEEYYTETKAGDKIKTFKERKTTSKHTS